MTSVVSEIFKRILVKFNCCKNRAQLELFAKKLLLSKRINTSVAIYTYSVGKLLQKLLFNKIRKLPDEIIFDSFSLFIQEAVNVLQNNKKYMSSNVFADLYGEYDEEDIRVLRIILWGWLSEVKELLDDVNFLLNESCKSTWKDKTELVNIFNNISITDNNVEQCIIKQGYTNSLAFQLARLCELAKAEPILFNCVFRHTEPVIKTTNVPFELRIEGARIQTLINNNCCFDKVL